MKVQSAGSKTVHDLEKEIAELKARINFQDMELTRISTANAEKTNKLRKLSELIAYLDIDPAVKKYITDSCLNMTDDLTVGKEFNMELTESDSVFLSKLQKKYPELNQRELRIMLLVKLDYETKDIALSLGVTTRCMESIRYRLHKKLCLGKNQSMKIFLSEFAMSL